MKVPSKEYDEIIEKITEEDSMDLTEVPPIFDLYEAQLDKEFLEELDKIILNQFNRILSYETLEETTSILNLCDLKIRPDSLTKLHSLNQPILNLSSSSLRFSLIILSEEIHETSCFSKDKEINNLLVLGTSNSLGSSNLLVS